MRLFPLIAAALLACLCPSGAALAGKLDAAANTVDAPDTPEPPRPPKSRNRHRDDDCDDDSSIANDVAGGFLGLFLTPLFDAFTSGLTGGNDSGAADVPNDGWTPGIPYYFSDYPYQGHSPGYMSSLIDERTDHRAWSRQVWVDYGTNFSELQSVGTTLRLESKSVWMVDANWRTYWEDLDTQGSDTLSFGSLRGLLRYYESPKALVRLGIGVPFMLYEDEPDAGFAAALAADFFPAKPFVLSFDADYGFIGQSDYQRLRPTMGWVHNRFEVLTGVEYLKFEDADLTNMIFGVRVWW